MGVPEKNRLDPVGFLQTTVWRDTRSATLTYFTFKPFWGQGFAKEGCQMVLHILRKHGDVAVVTANVDSENRSSLALLHSLGFHRKGYRIKADFFKTDGAMRSALNLFSKMSRCGRR